MAKKKGAEQEEPLEKNFGKQPTNCHKNIDAADYKHVALGLIFLDDAHKKLKADLITANPPFKYSDWSVILKNGLPH